MDLDGMLQIIAQQSGRRLNQEQRAVVEHQAGPLWVLAGPGSGKTEVLVLRCLKLACVDGVPPRSIILTTFTEKAARNIQERLALYKAYLDQADATLRAIDVFQLRIGTLHGLCNDIMQEYRYTGYQNYRLLDEIDQLLFVYEHSALAATSSNTPATHLPLWRQFSYLVDRYNQVAGYSWRPTSAYPPHRWVRANAAARLFNRIVEDRIDTTLMRAGGGAWPTLIAEYEQYVAALEGNLCSDFAHLQAKFLDFLSSPSGVRLLEGDGSTEQPGIRHVLVDEYQDTNPAQEAIYLQLARQLPHNLCVVGDDDQALYRFRGGTVECMVGFDQACNRAFGGNVSVTPLPLSTNYRSHPDIITWCDEYIRSFAVMNQPAARVPNKPPIGADPRWETDRLARGARFQPYPVVSFLVGRNADDVADRFATLVRALLDDGVIANPGQCVLLSRSTRDSATGPYQRALADRGIQAYNPRARTFLEQEEVRVALGALITAVDPDRLAVAAIPGGRGAQQVRDTVIGWMDTYNATAATAAPLAGYIARTIARIQQTPAGQTVTQVGSQGNTTYPATIQEMFYHILSFEPFRTWREEPTRTRRLAQVSAVLESYCSVPFVGRVGSTRGTLRMDATTPGCLNAGQLAHLYQALIGLLVSEGLNDPEDEDIICPPGQLPIMTVHQVKGLEFPFVFMANRDRTMPLPAELQLEDAMRGFRRQATATPFTQQERSDQDIVRLFYVAYSRAEYALILMTTAPDQRKHGMAFGGYDRIWFTQRVQQLT